MATRGLYIAAYDVRNPRRRRQIHHVVKGYATGGQKSAFECFLLPKERTELGTDVCSLMDGDEDRFALLRVEERTEAILLGTATPAIDPKLYYVG